MSRRSRSCGGGFVGAVAVKEKPRGSSLAATLRNKTAQVVPLKRVVAKVWVSTTLDTDVDISVKGATAESDPPTHLAAGQEFTTTFVGKGAAHTAFATVAGFPNMTLSLRHMGGPNLPGQSMKECADLEGRFLRHTFLNAQQDDDGNRSGRALEMEVIGSIRPGYGVPTLRLRLRDATEGEIKRSLQLQAMQDAMKGDDYGSLQAQITKARVAGVQAHDIAKAEQCLRAWQREGKHVEAGASHKELGETMQWALIKRVPRPTKRVQCPNADCQCNRVDDIVCGQKLEFVENAVQDCFGDSNADETLFNEIVNAALKVPEGCVWRAGGKFILSSFDRNQSVIALTRLMRSHGLEKAAKMILRLVEYSEAKYMGFVTAIQVNIHGSGSSFHAQHRDIYSAKQRAGPNCTCSFRACVGTVCYSLGSTRKVLTETMTDDMSPLEACGEDCPGTQEHRMFHSGEAMFFNEQWNSAHTHGIPEADDYECGPRISLAFLLGAERPGDKPFYKQ